MTEKTPEQIIEEIKEIVAVSSDEDIPKVIRGLIQFSQQPPGSVTIIFDAHSGALRSVSLGNVKKTAAGYSALSSACMQVAHRFQQQSLEKQREPQE
jgi:hypothetical protein